MADPTPSPPASPTIPAPREVWIVGTTVDGKPFRPSDWAERLCGVMAQFRPDRVAGLDAHLGYSPYVRPALVDGVRSVIVDERLRDLEPLAWEFVLNFAKDNALRTVDRRG